jgi:hypothetical protein
VFKITPQFQLVLLELNFERVLSNRYSFFLIFKFINMKISNANYPILKMLYNNKYDIYSHGLVNREDRESILKTDFVEEFKRLNSTFKEKVFKPSNTFIDAINKSESKLQSLVKEYILNGYKDLPINGTYIIFDMVYMIAVDIISPTIRKVTLYAFLPKGHPITKTTIEHNPAFNGRSKIIAWGTSSMYDNLKGDGNIDDLFRDFVAQLLYTCIITAIFKKHADIELKEVSGMSKKKDKHGVYINDTNLKITYLDSKWFTTIVKSDGFTVSGHFRLQPCKEEGCWTKKLIYINEFQKSGYTAPARKLVQSYI